MAPVQSTDKGWAVSSAPVTARNLDDRTRAVFWAVYGLMAVLVVGYLASLIIRGDDQLPVFSDWSVAGFEVVASLMCIARGVTRRSGRAVPLTLGSGLLAWALGDVVFAFESRGGLTPPTPSWADVFLLGFFPLTYVAFVIFMRGEARRLSTPSWLDGAVAGVGAAAVCAAFVFPAVLHMVGGDSAAAVTNLAYPVADLLLLGLAVGSSTLMFGQRKAPWMLMAGGSAVNIAGDTANLFASSWGHLGFVLNAAAWPASILLMSMSVWLRPHPTSTLTLQKPTTFLLPGVSTAGALVILYAGNLHPISRVALDLATVTLLLVGVRLVLSVRGVRALSQERRDQSLTDDLTGLGNRRCLSTMLDAFFDDNAATTAQPPPLAFLFLDLNRFKQINDTFGHPAGDQVLQQLGPRLSAGLRQSDLLIRLGGDEFVVVLLNANPDYAAAVAQRLTDELTKPFILDTMHASINATIGASIGIALAPGDATDSAGLLRCADIAMFRAKSSGAPFCAYDPDLDNEGNHLLLLAELRTAIEEHQLVLHYQPQLDLRTGKVVAVEALVRWAHPRLGIVPPGDFLPFAEDAGLMGPITTLVLADALAQCAAWWSADQQISVSVNISAANLLDPNFTELVRSLLNNHSLPGEALVLEITETSVISEFARSQGVIQELWDLGIVVSIDDFGAGFTSLAHLSSLAVKELKLDMTFITRLTAKDNPRDLDLVRSTIALGHALGLRIVAEGIENHATLELLASLGCDLGQGYYISKPMPANQLALSSTMPNPQLATTSVE